MFYHSFKTQNDTQQSPPTKTTTRMNDSRPAGCCHRSGRCRRRFRCCRRHFCWRSPLYCMLFNGRNRSQQPNDSPYFQQMSLSQSGSLQLFRCSNWLLLKRLFIFKLTTSNWLLVSKWLQRKWRQTSRREEEGFIEKKSLLQSSEFSE